MIAIPLLVWYSTYKNKDVPTNGLVYPLGNVFFRIYARVGNVRSRPAPQAAAIKHTLNRMPSNIKGTDTFCFILLFFTWCSRIHDRYSRHHTF